MWWKQKEENEAELKDCCNKGDYDKVKKLLSKPYAKPSVNCLYPDKFTPLHFASMFPEYKVVEILVENNANVNALNRLGKTPLHYACGMDPNECEYDRNTEKGDLDNIKIVKLLIEHGANPNIRDNAKRYPIDHATDQKIIDFLKTKTNFDVESSVSSTTKEQEKLIQTLNDERDIEAEIQKKKELRLKLLKELEESNQKRKMSEVVKKNEEEKLEYKPIGKQKLRPSSFEIMQPLGAGAFGQVWLVKNKNNDEIMAMKVIDKERLIKDDLIPYANTEKNIMLTLQHPFIIALKHSFQTPDKFFLLMEYC